MTIIAGNFREILALRGRIVLLTRTAEIALPFEDLAERRFADVVSTRGWADPYGPLLAWGRIHSAREHGLLSCDQVRYVTKVYRIPCTDVVWVGSRGDALLEVGLHLRHQASRNFGDELTRHWWIKEERP